MLLARVPRGASDDDERPRHTLNAPPDSPERARPWTPERVVERDAARAVAERYMPVTRLEHLGEGWDNTAWLCDGAVVFRFPRRRVAVPLLEQEIAVLGELAPQLAGFLDPGSETDPARALRVRKPLAITAPIYSGHDDDGWPFAAYRFLPGEALASAKQEPDAALGRTLGEFLRALHAARVTAPLGGDVWRKVDVGARLEATRALGRQAGVALPEAIVTEALAVPLAGRPTVVVHGDFDARHVLLDAGGNATGVIDWGDVHRGDPATDLAVAFSALSGPARAACLHAYANFEGLPGTLALARFRALHVSLAVLAWARDTGDSRLEASARHSLARVEEPG